MDEHSERHRRRDSIAAAIREGYTASFPSLGYTVERRPFGSYQPHAAGFGAVTADGLTPEAAGAFLADARAYYGGTPLRRWPSGV